MSRKDEDTCVRGFPPPPQSVRRKGAKKRLRLVASAKRGAKIVLITSALREYPD